jgi:hypothetical protein
MKKSITFFLSLTMFVYGVSLYAQGKGAGHAPSVGQGHSQSGNSGHGKSSEGQQSGSANTHGSSTTWQTKFSQRLQSDPAFKTRIQNLLPPGTDPVAAAAGFKNHGQFIAALHVSKNLGIPFDQLKAKMTGISTTSTGQTTTAKPMSLGEAIHELQPTLTTTQATEEVKKAEKQASLTEKSTPTT